MSRIKVVRSKALAEIIEFALLLTIVFLVRTYGFGLYQVPSGSMETTMLKGERFYADKFSYAFLTTPQRGDIIAFNEPRYQYSANPLKRWWQYYVWGPSNWTKRIIGAPGDHIRGEIEGGHPVVYVNGEERWVGKPGDQVNAVVEDRDPVLYTNNRIQSTQTAVNKVKTIVVYVNDQEQFTGAMGDRIQVVTEGGTPVVYRNGEKLNEPYLNHYPLIAEYKEESASLMDKLDDMARRGFEKGKEDEIMTYKSYDPNVSWENQKFYRIDPKRIVINSETKKPKVKEPAEPVLYKYMDRGQEVTRNMDEFDIKLGPDEYWVMGDNRRYSGDSRFWGPIHRKNTYIHAKILYRIWSVDSDAWFWLFDLIQHPVDFFKRVRWDRFFQKVN